MLMPKWKIQPVSSHTYWRIILRKTHPTIAFSFQKLPPRVKDYSTHTRWIPFPSLLLPLFHVTRYNVLLVKIGNPAAKVNLRKKKNNFSLFCTWNFLLLVHFKMEYFFILTMNVKQCSYFYISNISTNNMLWGS